MSRIVEARVDVVETPLHTPFVTAVRSATGTESVVLRLVDDDGVTGWGEGPQSLKVTGDSLESITAALEGPLRALLVGATPDDLPDLLRRVQDAAPECGGARMAADLALHDLAARRAGVSLTQLLGGSPGAQRVHTDVTLSAGSVDGLAAAAADRVAEGFDVLKLKVGTDAATDAARVRAVRETVGPDVAIRVDANQGWDVASAIAVITALEDQGLGVELVEQPVARPDLVGLAEVARAVRTPVMADESVFTMADLEALARLGGVPMVNVKLAKCGGLAPGLALVARARELGMRTLVGSMMEGLVGVAAAAALVAATGADLVPDLDAAWWAASSPYAGGPVYDGGSLVLPGSPGLGIEGLVS